MRSEIRQSERRKAEGNQDQFTLYSITKSPENWSRAVAASLFLAGQSLPPEVLSAEVAKRVGELMIQLRSLPEEWAKGVASELIQKNFSWDGSDR